MADQIFMKITDGSIFIYNPLPPDFTPDDPVTVALDDRNWEYYRLWGHPQIQHYIWNTTLEAHKAIFGGRPVTIITHGSPILQQSHSNCEYNSLKFETIS